MASQILLTIKLTPVVTISGDTDERNLPSAGATVSRANGVDEAGALAVASGIAVIRLASKKITRIHGGEVSKLVIAPVELERVGGTGGLVVQLSLEFEMGLFVVGRVEWHDVRIAPDNHDILVVVFEFGIIL
jgi:hypothetical protein